MDSSSRELLEAELASLLDVDPRIAREALQRCGYCLEVAVDVACELSASHHSGGFTSGGSSSSSARPAAPVLDDIADDAEIDELGASSDLEISDDEPVLMHRRIHIQRPVEPFSKRRKTEHDREKIFPMPDDIQLQGNQNDLPANNPPKFRDYPLREEQLKSLGWMLAQESHHDRGLKGGLLADVMGYGKTATAIGLISLGNKQKTTCKQGYIVSPATLIMCPPRLVQQWEEEFVKFLGKGVVIWHSSNPARPNVTKKADVLNVLVIVDYKKTTSGKSMACKPGELGMKDFCLHFDVVLVSADIQVREFYKSELRSLAETKAGVYTERVCEALRTRIGNSGKKFNFHDRFPVFQAFWWHRIILDEFHESESWVYSVREMIRGTGASHRWGLSGTPPLSSCNSVSQVAELLWYQKLETSPLMKQVADLDSPIARCKKRNQLRGFIRREKLRQLHGEVGTFLNDFVRQNSSQLIDAIQIEEHLELVEHIPEERLIYRQACHDNGVFDLQNGYDDVSLEAREALLRRCAHFDIVGGAECASTAMQQLGVSKEERIKSVQQQLRIDAGRAVLLGCWSDCQKELRSKDIQHTDALTFVSSLIDENQATLATECREHGLKVKKEMVTAQGELRLRPEVKLKQPVEQSECYANHQHCHAIAHEVARRTDRHAAAVLAEMQICEQACRGPVGKAASKALVTGLPRIAGLLDAACRSLQFYKAQLQGMASGSAEECSICLEPMHQTKDLALLPCSHIFHTSCVREVLKTMQKCPNCQQPVQLNEMSSMVLELQKPQPKPKASNLAQLPHAFRTHGSKFNAIASCLRKIRADDSTAQVIIFVQWVDLEEKVAKALSAYDLPFACPQGKASIGDEMREFQARRGPWILILSLERAASGMQLTAANHVVFVHPMNASSCSVAKDYEQQAIGRIRRIGQSRSSVHVWRFVARDTVEEHISKLHMPDTSGRPPAVASH